MTGRERYFAIMNFEHPDRWPDVGHPVWLDARLRWESEGLPKGVDPNQYLETDDGWMMFGLPINLELIPPFEEAILKEEEWTYVIRSKDGAIKRIPKADWGKDDLGDTVSMPEWLEFPVKDLASWETIKERLDPHSPERLPADWSSVVEKLNKGSEDRIVRLAPPLLGPGSFGPLRTLMGLERLSYVFFEEPELIRRILGDLVKFWKEALAPVLGSVRVDICQFFEDIGSSRGPIISPAMFREFCASVYEEMIDFYKSYGVTRFMIDSDGSVTGLVPEFIRVGITEVVPTQQTEPSMHPANLRQMFPQFGLWGGIRRQALLEGTDAIDKELKKCWSVARRELGYIPCIDGGISYDISWENFRYFAEQNKLYASGEMLV
ncbi:MAG: hypothetical protein HYX78_01195 [Armatimonadetes bacterium]|nr:hypothetical protein [Armatimonadota bacterium]